MYVHTTIIVCNGWKLHLVCVGSREAPRRAVVIRSSLRPSTLLSISQSELLWLAMRPKNHERIVTEADLVLGAIRTRRSSECFCCL